MHDPLRTFRNWLGGNEVGGAVLQAASAEESLGLAADSLPAELERIAGLLALPSFAATREAYRWATAADSYRLPADAHFQYLALWFADFVREAWPHLADGQRITLAAVLRNRKRTPFANNETAGCAFIAVPAGFLVAVDLYFRTHFRLRDLGEPAAEPADRCVSSNAIGGQHIESAFAHRWSEALAVLLQLEGGYLAAELFDPDLESGIPVGEPLDHYVPDLISSTAQIFPELTGRGGPYVPMQPSPESQAAAYLCALFALFHELAHQLVGDDGIEMARRMGISDPKEANAIEAAVDLLALGAYCRYVDEQSRRPPAGNAIDAVPHPARYTLGPSAFHSVGKSVELAEWAFYSAQRQADPRQAARGRARLDRIAALQWRQVGMAERLSPLFKDSAQGKLDEWHLLSFGAFFEARCVEVALRLTLDSIRYRRRSRFCDHYEV